MANIRFYKKLSPETAIALADGTLLQRFKTVSPGDPVGYFATNQPGLQAYFDDLMRAGKYALTEISETDFHEEYVKKKDQPSKPIWREELSKNSAGITSQPEPMSGNDPRLSAVAVKGCDQPGRPACAVAMETASPSTLAAAQAATNAVIAQELSKPATVRPAAGRRGKSTRAKNQPPTA